AGTTFQRAFGLAAELRMKTLISRQQLPLNVELVVRDAAPVCQRCNVAQGRAVGKAELLRIDQQADLLVVEQIVPQNSHQRDSRQGNRSDPCGGDQDACGREVSYQQQSAGGSAQEVAGDHRNNITCIESVAQSFDARAESEQVLFSH